MQIKLRYVPVDILRQQAEAIVADPFYAGRPDIMRREAEMTTQVVLDGEWARLSPSQVTRLRKFVDEAICDF